MGALSKRDASALQSLAGIRARLREEADRSERSGVLQNRLMDTGRAVYDLLSEDAKKMVWLSGVERVR